MKFNPTKNRVLIKPILNEQKTESGIILPGQENNYSDFALVEAIGCDVKSVKVGDFYMCIFQDVLKEIWEGDAFVVADGVEKVVVVGGYCEQCHGDNAVWMGGTL